MSLKQILAAKSKRPAKLSDTSTNKKHGFGSNHGLFSTSNVKSPDNGQFRKIKCFKPTAIGNSSDCTNICSSLKIDQLSNYANASNAGSSKVGGRVGSNTGKGLSTYAERKKRLKELRAKMESYNQQIRQCTVSKSNMSNMKKIDPPQSITSENSSTHADVTASLFNVKVPPMSESLPNSILPVTQNIDQVVNYCGFDGVKVDNNFEVEQKVDNKGSRTKITETDFFAGRKRPRKAIGVTGNQHVLKTPSLSEASTDERDQNCEIYYDYKAYRDNSKFPLKVAMRTPQSIEEAHNTLQYKIDAFEIPATIIPPKPRISPTYSKKPIVKSFDCDDKKFKESRSENSLVNGSPTPAKEKSFKKKRKKKGPFNVKVGCVVAVRIYSSNFLSSLSSASTNILSEVLVDDMTNNDRQRNDHSTTNACKTYRTNFPAIQKSNEIDVEKEVWIFPIPCLHFGLALVGRKIRFPSSYVIGSSSFKEQQSKSGRGGTRQKKQDEDNDTIVGEVVAIQHPPSEEDRKIGRTTVGVLVDGGQSALQVSLDALYGEGGSDIEIDWMISQIFFRRGSASLGKTQVSSKSLSLGYEDDTSDIKVKRVRKKHYKQKNLFAGDMYDDESQQSNNWQWLERNMLSASSSHDENCSSAISSNLDSERTENGSTEQSHHRHAKDRVQYDISNVLYPFVGEVLDISPSRVLLRRLYLPEHTLGGRTIYHNALEIFCDADGDYSNRFSGTKKKLVFETKIDNLVVLAKDVIYDTTNLKREKTEAEEPTSASIRISEEKTIDTKVEIETRRSRAPVTMTHSYSYKYHQYVALDAKSKGNISNEAAFKKSVESAENKDDLPHTDPSTPTYTESCTAQLKSTHESFVVPESSTIKNPTLHHACHRCRRMVHLPKIRQCSQTKVCGGFWWCDNCCKILRNNSGLFSLYQISNWSCPSCVGSCDCRSCRSGTQSSIQSNICQNISSAAKDINVLFDRDQNDCESDTSTAVKGNVESLASNAVEDKNIESARCLICSRPCTKLFSKCKKCDRVTHKSCSEWNNAANQCQASLHSSGTKYLKENTFTGSKVTSDTSLINDAAKSGDSNTIPSRAELKKKRKREKIEKSNAKLCRHCLSRKKCARKNQSEFVVTNSTDKNNEKYPNDHFTQAFHKIHLLASMAGTLDFDIPTEFFKDSPAFSDKPCVFPAKKRPPVRVKKENNTSPKSLNQPGRAKSPSSTRKDIISNSSMVSIQRDLELRKRCSRILPYDPNHKNLSKVFDSDLAIKTRRNLILENRIKSITGHVQETSKSSGRAARANQRRMLKDNAFGAQGIGWDALSTREPQLRFGKSPIHRWGVFADEDLNAGDMVLEYRGELIGNAMADARELEYEKAKIGSDYMFRIDSTTVCDATKEGCLARFINASCNPNCFTQIINVKGIKRIVIYAKKDIQKGDELCYDYKFESEFDKQKRVECFCGAPDCFGYLNWDKRSRENENNAINDI